MGEYVIKNEEKLQKKKKKKLSGLAKFFITLVCIIVLLPAIAVGAIYACFYDGSHVSKNHIEDYPTEKVFKEVLVDSLNETTSQKRISLKVTEDQINQILYNSLIKDLDENSILKNLYFDANDGLLKFGLELDAFGFFKTTAVISTGIEYINEEDKIEFKISDIKIGRIGGFNKIINSVSGLIESNIPDLSEIFKQAGLNIKFDLADLKLTYNLEDFYKDITKMLGESEGETFLSIVKEVLSNKALREIGATGKNLFEMNVDLSTMKVSQTLLGIEGYVVPEGLFSDAYRDIKLVLLDFLNENKISLEDVDVVSKYLMGGDNILSIGEKEAIDVYKNAHVFESVQSNIPYHDYSLPQEEQLKNVILNQIPSVPTNFDITVDTEQLDKMMCSSPAIGLMSNLARKVPNNTEKPYIVNSVAVERLTSVVKDDILFVTISVDINGEPIHMTLKCKEIASTGFAKIDFEIKQMYLGDIAVTEETKNTFMKIITKSFNGEAFDGYVDIDGVNNLLSFNFSNVLNEKGITDEYFNVSFSLNSTTKDTSGSLIASISAK